MKPAARAIHILKGAEAQLRELLAAAAAEGEYADVVKMAAWARAIADMTASALPGSTMAGDRTATRTSTDDAVSRPARIKAADYPRFFRHGDRLIRVSWSKREKKEYEHKAPRAVVNALAARLSEVGRDGRVFSTDELLPISLDSDGEVPSYQVYAALALLRQVGLVDQHGRKGYSVPRIKELKSSLESVWQKLPER